ncbi:hypothetical protein ACGF5M_00850 [Gemmatimonadota bacterium]
MGIALESNRFGMSRQTLYLYVDIPIIDGFFNFSDGELEVEGQLNSPTEASGVFRLVDEVQQPGQYGMTTGTVRGTGEWSASPSPALAQPPERGPTREAKVHFDGLYQAASSQSGVFKYLRFYADGTVVSVSSTGTLEQVARWFNRTASSKGRYTVRDLEIEFSSTSPEGTVDYEGTIEPNGLTLKWYSHINGREGSGEYQFFPLPE